TVASRLAAVGGGAGSKRRRPHSSRTKTPSRTSRWKCTCRFKPPKRWPGSVAQPSEWLVTLEVGLRVPFRPDADAPHVDSGAHPMLHRAHHKAEESQL